MGAVGGAVNAAEDRVWGHGQEQAGEEPVAGAKGSGTATDPYDGGNATGQPGNPVEGHSEGSSARLDRDSATSRPGNTTENSQSAQNELEDSLKQSASPPENDLDPAGVPGNSRTLTHEDTEEPPRGWLDPSSKDKFKTDADSESGSSQQSSDKSSEERSQVPHGNRSKSTGFAAQGGNFDAKASGAGKEADRLLEERGETLQAPSNSEEPQGKGTGDHHGGIWTGTHKSGISMAKAKEKLHIGKNQ